MDYKKNLRYFQNKKKILIIGFALLAAGLSLFFIEGESDILYIMYILQIPMIAAGLVLIIADFSMKASLKSIEEFIKEKTRFVERDVLKQFDLYERQIKFVNAVSMKSFDYTDRSLIRRDPNGKFITANYAVGKLYFTNDTLCFIKKTLSVVNDKESQIMGEYSYKDLIGAHIDESEFTQTVGKNSYTVKYYNYVIEGKDGVVFSCPSPLDHSLEVSLEDIDHLIKRANGEI